MTTTYPIEFLKIDGIFKDLIEEIGVSIHDFTEANRYFLQELSRLEIPILFLTAYILHRHLRTLPNVINERFYECIDENHMYIFPESDYDNDESDSRTPEWTQ